MAKVCCPRRFQWGSKNFWTRRLLKAMVLLALISSFSFFILQLDLLSRRSPAASTITSPERIEAVSTAQRGKAPTLPVLASHEAHLPAPQRTAHHFQAAQRGIKTSFPNVIHGTIKKEQGEQLQTRNKTDAPCIRHADNDTVHVVITADEKLFMGMLTLANSIVHNTASDVMFHFITFPLDAIVLRRWIKGSSLKSVPHEVVELPYDRLKGKFKVRAPRPDLSNPMNFARILMPELLPCVGRAIYIDDDCLVFGDIRELYDFKMAENHVISAHDHCNHTTGRGAKTIKLLNEAHPLVKKMGIPENACMFNNGMFVADLVKWEKYNISQQLQHWMEMNVREVIIKFSDGGAGSQALMNMVLWDKYSYVPQEWNAAGAGYHRYTWTPKLVHWKGPFKPWLYPRAPYFDEWMKYHVPDPEHRHVPIKVGMRGIRLQN